MMQLHLTELTINDHIIGIGADTGMRVSMRPIQGGGNFRRTVNGLAVPQARSRFRLYQIVLSGQGCMPPDIDDIQWADQIVRLGVPREIIAGREYVEAQDFRHPYIPGSIAYISDAGNVPTDGNGSLPDGFDTATITSTRYCPIFPKAIVKEPAEVDFDVDPSNYNWTVTFEEQGELP